MAKTPSSTQALSELLADTVQLILAGTVDLAKAGTGGSLAAVEGSTRGALRLGRAIVTQSRRSACGLTRGLRRQIERFVEPRMTRTLNALLIPTSRDVRELSERVAQLSAAIAAHEAAAAPRKRKRRPTAKAA